MAYSLVRKSHGVLFPLSGRLAGKTGPFAWIPREKTAVLGWRNKCFPSWNFLFYPGETFVSCWWNSCFVQKKLLFSAGGTFIFTKWNSYFHQVDLLFLPDETPLFSWRCSLNDLRKRLHPFGQSCYFNSLVAEIKLFLWGFIPELLLSLRMFCKDNRNQINILLSRYGV